MKLTPEQLRRIIREEALAGPDPSANLVDALHDYVDARVAAGATVPAALAQLREEVEGFLLSAADHLRQGGREP
ncbi:MAG: hypothetical protein EBR40_03130 [Proteobacteria bacterium]|nr:hypothetical protein [Pseudomonadota bacterium]